MTTQLPPKLEEIVADFSYCQGQEKLEYLLEYAEKLPSLPTWLNDQRADMDQVHECMTPVFVYAENRDGALYYHFDIPPEAPTVRGFASVLHEGVNGSTPQQVLQIPDQFYLQMGLQHVITGQRLNGIGAMLIHMKRLAQAHLN
jgi:cysteine desulfuration protein SufE